MIAYSTDVSVLDATRLTGFFVGWPVAPTAERHLAVLRGSHRVVLALDGDRVVGFVNLVSDGVLTGFVPWLEVLPEYRKKGIGAELVRRILAEAGHLYSVDLVCDPDVKPFYERLGFFELTGMGVRNRAALTA
ncbi:GNAT family N-acetyltransferase [Longispora sp. K20-0274]|uniref:GNAT family N-acetyltransferase n=1 Tax=Longispora sp. K20-0274 TaxID=3088255 RepID=UPI0039999A6B